MDVHTSDSIRPRHMALGWASVFIAALVLYVATLAPDLVWQDQGDYQYQAALCNLERPGDLVRVHPLYIIVAHLVGETGFFSYAYAANLVNAVFTCITIANVYLIVTLLGRQSWPSVLAAAMYGLAHSVWFLGVQAQTYGMATATMSAAVALTIRYVQVGGFWRLMVMGLLFGLGASIHMISQVAFVVIMLWLIGRAIRGGMSITTVIAVVICWVLGAGALWAAAAMEYKHAGSVAAIVHSALVGKWGGAVFNYDRVAALMKKSVLFFVLNFPTPLVLLAIGGIVLSFKRMERTLAWLLIAMTICYCVFAVRYDVPNQNNFFVPLYMFIAVYCGLGFMWIVTRAKKICGVAALALLIMVPLTYVAIADYAGANSIELGTRRHIPYRDTYTYYIIPWQRNQTGPRRMAAEMMQTLPPGAIVLADTTTIPPLLYVHRIEGARPDVRIAGLDEPKEEMLACARQGIRLFTISDVKGYYPGWVSPMWLRPFRLSEAEKIFEIVPG